MSENENENNNTYESYFVMPDITETKKQETDGMWFEIPGIGNPKNIELKIKFFSPSKMIQYTNKMRVQKKNSKTGRIEVYDDDEKKIEISRSMVLDAVTGWKGIVDPTLKPLEFTRDNFVKFMELMSFNRVNYLDEDGEKMTLSSFIIYCAQSSDMHFGEKKN